MATFYIQLENKLLQISGDLTAENISKAIGYVPVSPNVTNELSQRVDNITFDSLKDNPFLQDGSGELNIVDEAGNIIAKIDADGIHSVDFIALGHRLSDKADKTYVDESLKNVNVDLTSYATEEWVTNQNYLTEHQDISHLATKDEIPSIENLATKDEIPTKVSDLENDSNYLTEHQNISHLATKEEVSNIDFYNIKDNPIVNNGDGKLLFVDESGYIGLQLEEDGLYVKDVIADGHTLSQKADKSELPTKVSQLENDSKFITVDEVPEVTVPTKVSDLENDKGYITASDIPEIEIPSLDEYAKTEDLPNFDEFAKTEDIPSLDGYAKTSDIPSLDGYASKEWVNNNNYATEYDLKNIDYSAINNVPISEDETGELNITDENGNIGMKVASEAVYAKDFVAGEHKLSEKADKTYVDNSIAGLVDGAPETLDTLNELAAALNDNADIVDVLNQSISNKQDAISDLETIRQGAAKGATALQSYTEQYKGTVTGIKINGTTKNPSSGVVNLGTVITSHQTLKTINGESIVGSGNITISGGSSDANVQAVDTEDVIDDVTVDYATKAYVDGLIGDINSVLESIINGGVTNLFPITLINNGGVPNDTYAKVYTELQKIVGEESTPVVIDSGLIFIDLTSFAVIGSNNYEVTTVWYNSILDNLWLAELENGPETTVVELSSDGIISVRFM